MALHRWAKAQRAVSQKAREDTIRALVAGFQDESVQPLLSSPSSTSKEESSRSLFLENANQALFPTSSRRDSTQIFPSTAFMTPEQVRRMMGLLPIEPFFPEERTGVGEEIQETVDFQTDFDSKFEPPTTSSSLPGVFADPRANLSPGN